MPNSRILLLASLLLVGCFDIPSDQKFVEGCARICAESGQVMHGVDAYSGAGTSRVCTCWKKEKGL